MTDSQKLDLIIAKFEKIDSLENDVKTALGKIDSLENNVKNIETTLEKIDSLENDVRSIKSILENEIRVNIQRVAEGHLDLSRNLHDAMRPNNEVEMLAIRVRMLETEVKELRQKIS